MAGQRDYSARRWAPWGVTVVIALVVLACTAPSVVARTTKRSAAYANLITYLNAYRDTGFANVEEASSPDGAMVVSLCTRQIYLKRFREANIKFDPSLKEVAQYDVASDTITFRDDPRELPRGTTRMGNGETVWHELTHALEGTRGDVGITDSEAYRERNVDYMQYVYNRALPALVILEKNAKRGASVELLKGLWQKYLDEMVAASKLPSALECPPDLELMNDWFGFSVDPAEVKDLYLSGKALPGKLGENLRRALSSAMSPQDWQGTWSTDAEYGSLRVTVSGTTMTGVWETAPGSEQDKGVISADGSTLEARWTEFTNGTRFWTTFLLTLHIDPSGTWHFEGSYVDGKETVGFVPIRGERQ